MSNSAIKEWMNKHVSEYSSGVALATAAMNHFGTGDNWIWDTAQQIFDINKRQNTSKRYA